MTEKGITPRFRLWVDAEGNKGFHAIQRPGPTPQDEEFEAKEHVYMTVEDSSGPKAYHLVPLAEVKAREAEGWELWKCPEQPVDENGKDRRRCNWPQDVITTDKPHLDTEHYFSPSDIEFTKKHTAPPNWEPHMPLEENYDDEDNISTAKEFRPPNEWKQVVSGSSNAHFRKTRRPHGIGLGWGDYDKFYEWESHGRRVTPDMVVEKEWSTKLSDLDYVDSEDPSLITTMKVDDATKEAAELREEPKPLWDVMNAREAEKKATGNNDGERPQNNRSGLAGTDGSVF